MIRFVEIIFVSLIIIITTLTILIFGLTIIERQECQKIKQEYKELKKLNK